MKKATPFLAGLLALSAVGLASCGGSDEDFMEALDADIVYAPNTILPGLGGGVICASNTPSDGSSIRVLKKLLLSNGKTAEYEWDFSESEDLVEKVFAWDESFDNVRVKYSETESVYFTFTLKSIKIGGAKKTLKQLQSIYSATYGDEELVFNVECQPAQFKYDAVPVSYFTKLNDAGDKYVCVDYDSTEDNTFVTNYGQKKFDCTTKGKIVYVSPDYNFFNLQDGAHTVEVYFGAGSDVAPNYFPEIKVGNYVEVRGYLDQYEGNFQVTIINRIRELTDAEKATIAEPNPAYKVLSASDIAGLKISDEPRRDRIVVAGLMNSMVEVTGHYEAGSLAFKGGSSTSSMTRIDRYFFNLNVGGEVLCGAFDKHAILTKEDKLFTDMNGIFADPSKEVTLRGTIRYDSSTIKDSGNAGSGVWRFVPLQVL